MMENNSSKEMAEETKGDEKRLRRKYTRCQMEALRFAQMEYQLEMFNQVFRGSDPKVRRELDGLSVADFNNKNSDRNRSNNNPWNNRCHRGFHQETLVPAGPSNQSGAAEIRHKVENMEEETKGDEKRHRRKYTRCEMEALRFAQLDYQLQMFNQFKTKRQFNGLIVVDFKNKNNDCSRSKNNPGNNHGSSNQSGMGDICDKFENMEWEEDDDISDDSYDGILKPALLVEGEPDFESGPPVDGWEYLRRVRWEANQLPDVKVAKLNLTETCAEQTPYMPQIPDLPKCPPNLLPSKKWEDSFLDDFSQLREAFSQLDSSVDPSGSFSKLKSSIENQSQIIPTVSAILNMDAVSRAATLRNYISMSESMERLSKHDCQWLFALCATVDMPLHADTCASLRCLLRKCLGILATKSEIDVEVAMLNVLVSICGKYFRQFDNTYR